MISIKQAIVVEGKYDKIKLENLVDTMIITVNGFSVFNDLEKIELIRAMAAEKGIIIFTDSDSAGFMIRAHIAGLIQKGTVRHAYIPDVYGREKRKRADSGEGKIGVEGMDGKTILAALKLAGAEPEQRGEHEITRLDLFKLGLTGGENSANKRRELLKSQNLPERMSTSALLRVLQERYKKEELCEIMEKIAESDPVSERGA